MSNCLAPRRWFTFAGLLFIVTSAPGTGQPAQNLGFEEGQTGGTPVGWVVPAREGFSVDLVADEVREGGWAVRIAREDVPGWNQFGAIRQLVDATPYRGQRVRLRAWVRTEFPPDLLHSVGQDFLSRAVMWMRVRSGEETAFLDEMDDRPIREPLWRAYEIVGDVAEDATTIGFGLRLFGAGRVWVDDFSLEVVGPAAPPVVEPPRPLSARGMENLIAFTRLLGYVRYFHPSDQAADLDWDEFAVSGVRAVEGAADDAELARALHVLFGPIAPTVTVWATNQPRSQAQSVTAGQATSTLIWRHNGVGTGGDSYWSERVRAPASGGVLADGFPDPRQPLVIDLGADVHAAVPLAVYADADGTLPRVSAGRTRPDPPLPTQGAFTGDDRAARLAAVTLLWPMFHHFYVYFDVVDVDWDSELHTALEAAATDADAQAFLTTLRRMTAALQDGHIDVRHASEQATHVPPFLWDIVEGELMIIAVAEAATGLRVGDTVDRVDGRPAETVLAEARALISAATPQWGRFRATRALLRGPEDSEIRLQVRGPGDGTVREVTVRRTRWPNDVTESRPDAVAELRPGIFYVDLERVNTDSFNASLPRLSEADGIIFDMRGYPQVFGQMVLSHLVAEPVVGAQMHHPVASRPDRSDLAFNRSEWDIQPATPHLAAPRVFLTDGRAISAAESFMSVVEHYRLGQIVGEATAGTNGNVNPFWFPGGYRGAWTGMKVLKHDGSRFHGVGIQPTVPVVRTAAGVTAGVDEQLEQAIRILEGN
jgi:C-terminal processing protease CtpA/Prc